LVRDRQLIAKLAKLGRATKTLRAEFEKKTVTSDGMDDPARTRRGFDQGNVNTCLAESVGADEAGDAPADNQCLDLTSHGAVSILARSECFRKERLGDELLFFEVRIEHHGQIANENAAEPSRADFAAVEERETILP
jgi:hypothetical protein